MTAELWQLALIVAVGVLAVYAVYRSHSRGEPITVPGVITELREAYGPAQEFVKMVQMAVSAAEQMKRDGRIDSNAEAYNYVTDYLIRKIPPEWGVTREDIDMAIDAAVLTSSALSKQAGKSGDAPLNESNKG